MSEPSNPNSRRDWIQNVGIGSALVGIGVVAGRITAPRPENVPPTSSETVATSAGKRAVSSRLQVFCHGMMIFELPPAKDKILIHIPDINPSTNPHVYMAGKADKTALQTLTRGGYYTLGGGVTASTTGKTPQGMWDSNLHFSSQPPCSVSSVATGNTKEYCVIELPMPDDYHGCNQVQQTIITDAIFSPGPITANCVAKITSLYLIQVFRYNNFTAGAALRDKSGTSVWDIQHGGLIVHIYAEPQQKTPPGDVTHLDMLNDFYKPKLDLAFTDATQNNIVNPNMDGEITNVADVWCLADVWAGRPQGGDVADCVNGYGS